MSQTNNIQYETTKYQIIPSDCREWLKVQPPNSFHAIITDPPYGMREYSEKELEKLNRGRGGIWRIPPKIGGSKRRPLPRFTVLTPSEIERLRTFFYHWAILTKIPLVPGGHIFIASNPALVHIVSSALANAGFECRGIIVRQVRTLKGGFRPKLSEKNIQAFRRFHAQDGSLGLYSENPSIVGFRKTSGNGEQVD